MQPIASICMPIYNGERFLRKAIDSVLAQDFTDFELIICDDCSTDDSVKIIESYDDPRIILHRNDHNYGLAGNWNHSISFAKGKYIKIMMQDDILCQGALSKQVSLMEAHPEASLAVGNTSIINEEDKTIVKRFRYKKERVINGKRYAKRSLRGRNIFCEPPNHLFRKADFDKYGPYDDSLAYCPDWDMCLTLSEIGDIVCTDTEVMRFRLSSTQTTSKVFSKSEAFVNNDSYQMFIKHMKSGILGLNRFDYFIFWFVIKINSLAKTLFLLYH